MAVSGPSPRGRGNRQPERMTRRVLGSIPAWAGKPTRPSTFSATAWVHPRVGGETLKQAVILACRQGPSPRGRGNLPARHPRTAASRSIPAWAGKPAGCGWPRPMPRVHPRVGGETLHQLPIRGLSTGPSPRGRGNLAAPGARGAGRGSIPAWAGKPVGAAPCERPSGVHPRVGGETHMLVTYTMCLRGPSPRGRGNHRLQRLRRRGRSIPAWAGKPALLLRQNLPRWGPSPRGRGNLRHRVAAT